MFIMGDVLAVVAAVVGIGATLWAAILAFTVLFQNRVRQSAELALHWKPTLLWGAGSALIAGGFGLVLANQPNGLGKLIGYVLLLGLLSVAVLGSAGLAWLTGKRVIRLNPAHSTLGATGRGAALLIAAGFLPVLGWFGFFPILALLSLGAGTRALFRRVRVAPVVEKAAEPTIAVR